MAKPGKGLKAALQSQQSRLKAKEKAAQAAQAAELKARQRAGQSSGAKNGVDVKGKKKAVSGPPKRPVIPFKLSDKILLIGEGNFSFARALVENAPDEIRSLPPSSITATAYDSEKECYEKYPESAQIVAFLKSKGVTVLFSVDGTHLEKHPALKGKKWDRIVWNFPHAGKGIADQDRNILTNQLLILGFLRSAANMLQLGPAPAVPISKKKLKSMIDDNDDDDAGVLLHGGFPAAVDLNDTEEELQFLAQPDEIKTRGTVLITLRNVVPYTQWDVPRLAKNPPPPTSSGRKATPNPPYILQRSFQFHRDIWKGYEHRMTKGERAHGKGTTGEGGEDRTWEFYLKDKETEE